MLAMAMRWLTFSMRKDRPKFNPLISHIANAETAFQLGAETDFSTVLANCFWPGPLTLVLNRTNDCPVAMLTTAGLDKIALRVPAHEQAQKLLAICDMPIAAPSANPSGHISPSTADHVYAGLAGKIDLILDGGPVKTVWSQQSLIVVAKHLFYCGPVVFRVALLKRHYILLDCIVG